MGDGVMFCTKCQNPVHRYECGDIEERLAELAAHPNFATDRCSNCQKHPRECTCDEYEPYDGGLE